MHFPSRSVRGISTLLLVLLLLFAGSIGAVLSYLWTAGYYIDFTTAIPEDTVTVAIMNVTFSRENCTYFDVTLMNPSYSKTDAEVEGIVLLSDADTDQVDSAEPAIPYPLKRGESKTFKCNLNWGAYAGQNLTVAVLIKDGSGGTKSHQTELVKLEILDVSYNTSISLNQVSMTVRNPSRIPLNVSKVLIGTGQIPPNKILVNSQNITFPYTFPQNDTRVFECSYNLWDSETSTGVLGTTKTITFETRQGYEASLSEVFANPVVLTLSDVTFPLSNTTQFILKSESHSPHSVNISQITVEVGDITYTVASDNTNATGYILERDTNVTIVCADSSFNWNEDNWKGQVITIRVYTTQGFVAKEAVTVPSA